MKLDFRVKNKRKYIKKLIDEDRRELQKKISGRSVYKKAADVYRRIPKHRHRWNEYQYHSIESIH